MNKKIIGILVVTLLIVTVLPVPIIGIRNIDDDAPVWKVGDKWIYNMDPIVIDVEEDDFTLDANLDIGDLTLEVVSVSGDSYDVNFHAEINGGFYVYIDRVSLELTGDFANSLFAKTELEGNMIFRKSDIGIKEMNLQLSFVLKLKINNVIPIRVPAVIELNIGFDNPLKPMDFPISVGKKWGSPSNTVTIDGQISSRWLNRLKLLNRFLNVLPPEIADLLPVIDIGDLIEYAGGDNSFEIPGADNSFECISQEDITVEAGTFNAYKINIYGDKGTFYYALEAGMVIKVSELNLQEYLPFLGDFNFELSETNYS